MTGVGATRSLRALFVGLVVSASLTAGCNFTAHTIKPEVELEGAKNPAVIALQLDEAVREDVLLMAENGLPQLDIKGFRTAVKDGLEQGLGQRFTPGEGGWILLVEMAEPELVPLEWGPDGSVSYFAASITYRARLFDPAHGQKAEFEGVASSSKPFQGVSDGSPLIADAIEGLTRDLVAKAEPVITKAPAAPEVQIIKTQPKSPAGDSWVHEVTEPPDGLDDK